MVDLWTLRTADLTGERILRAANALLTEEERARQMRFVFEKNRHEFLATRTLCRTVLADALGRPPASLAFAPGPYGRPELAPPESLSFNLTNTVWLVACVISRTATVGVDAEPMARADTIIDVAETVFTPHERAALAAATDHERALMALRLWTAKEAYMKARGLGMSLPPRSFELDARSATPALRHVAPAHADPRHWDFQAFEVGDHLVTTCVERASADTAPAIITLRDFSWSLLPGAVSDG